MVSTTVWPEGMGKKLIETVYAQINHDYYVILVYGITRHKKYHRSLKFIITKLSVRKLGSLLVYYWQ